MRCYTKPRVVLHYIYVCLGVISYVQFDGRLKIELKINLKIYTIQLRKRKKFVN